MGIFIRIYPNNLLTKHHSMNVYIGPGFKVRFFPDSEQNG